MLVFKMRPPWQWPEAHLCHGPSAASFPMLHHAGLGPASQLLHLQFSWNTLMQDYAFLVQLSPPWICHPELSRSSSLCTSP